MKSILREILKRALAELPRVAKKWLAPCNRLAWAMYRLHVNERRGRDAFAGFWRWRVDVLRTRCDKLTHRVSPDAPHVCATTIATIAAAELRERFPA